MEKDIIAILSEKNAFFQSGSVLLRRRFSTSEPEQAGENLTRLFAKALGEYGEAVSVFAAAAALLKGLGAAVGQEPEAARKKIETIRQEYEINEF